MDARTCYILRIKFCQSSVGSISMHVSFSSRNNIDDIAQVEFLSLCSKLRILTLQGNPVESAPHPETKEQVRLLFIPLCFILQPRYSFM